MTGIRLGKVAFLVNLIFQCAFLSLYYIFSVSLQQIVGSSGELFFVAYGIYHLIIAITLMVCMFFLPKINKTQNIYRCAISMLATFILILLFPKGPFGVLFIFIEAIFLAIGQLLSFTYFWSLTVSEERGRIAGFIGFFTIPFTWITALLAESLELFGGVLLAVFLILGILATKLLKPEESHLSEGSNERVGSYYEKRAVLLYAIPWILFSLVNGIFDRSLSLNLDFSRDLYVMLLVLQTIAAAFGALGGGIVADLFGRKLSLSSSLTLYGISIALSGFAQNIEVFYFVFIVSGLNWGILWSLYGSVVWGDLANEQNCVKRYASGLIIFYLPLALGLLFTSQILLIPVVWSALAGCSLIFISNLPLFLAPELLSEDFRDKIRLRLHMKAVKKLDEESHSQG